MYALGISSALLFLCVTMCALIHNIVFWLTKKNLFTEKSTPSKNGSLNSQLIAAVVAYIHILFSFAFPTITAYAFTSGEKIIRMRNILSLDCSSGPVYVRPCHQHANLCGATAFKKITAKTV